MHWYSLIFKLTCAHHSTNILKLDFMNVLYIRTLVAHWKWYYQKDSLRWWMHLLKGYFQSLLAVFVSEHACLVLSLFWHYCQVWEDMRKPALLHKVVQTLFDPCMLESLVVSYVYIQLILCEIWLWSSSLSRNRHVTWEHCFDGF